MHKPTQSRRRPLPSQTINPTSAPQQTPPRALRAVTASGHTPKLTALNKGEGRPSLPMPPTIPAPGSGRIRKPFVVVQACNYVCFTALPNLYKRLIYRKRRGRVIKKFRKIDMFLSSFFFSSSLLSYLLGPEVPNRPVFENSAFSLCHRRSRWSRWSRAKKQGFYVLEEGEGVV